MKNKKFIILVLAAFILGTSLLIYIQYNSTKNMNLLISGNEQYLQEYTINSELKGLENDIVKIESNVSNIVSTNDSEYGRGVDSEMNKVQTELVELQKISGDEFSEKKIDELDIVVKKVLRFNKDVLDCFYTKGKGSAEKMIGTLRGKRLMDSVYSISQDIANSRLGIIAKLTISNDKNEQKAQQFNTILIILVLFCGAGLFWYIISTVRKKESLIRQLHDSELKVREAAQVKERFMANMSHEIRTPLNAILGFANLLQGKHLDEESKGYVKTIQNSGDNLLAIINDILDLSKIEAGMMQIESAPFNIRELLHSVEVMFRAKAAEKGIQVFMDVDDSVPHTLGGDATRLTQILINLVSNALKFTKKGHVSVKIRSEDQTGDIIHTRITVSDTGIGIEEDKRTPIFNRFQQADASVTRQYGGTGLGLSIVHELVLLQNGTITVESEVGKGTDFIIMIPYKIRDEQKPGSISLKDRTSYAHSAFKGMNVLVAEDNEINQSLIRHLFKNWELQYDIARDGKEALQKLTTGKYNLVLMDIQMPEMDGYTATREIREKLGLPVPIIAMTAHALTGEKEKCLSYGMNDYIAKPIKEDQLYELIARFSNIPVKEDGGSYQYINLQYMREVSQGNSEYEKTVTLQFIEAIPNDLAGLKTAWQDQDVQQLQRLAHNMKTTVSVMGLNEILQPHLDTLEYEIPDDSIFNNAFLAIRTVCEASLKEAEHFYNTL